MSRSVLCAALLFVFGAAFSESAMADHWGRHDGRWYYWSDPDARWYYGDGQNWYYGTNDGWKMYGFDGKFGNDWEIDRDDLEFDDDAPVPAYGVPPVPARVKIDD